MLEGHALCCQEWTSLMQTSVNEHCCALNRRKYRDIYTISSFSQKIQIWFFRHIAQPYTYQKNVLNEQYFEITKCLICSHILDIKLCLSFTTFYVIYCKSLMIKIHLCTVLTLKMGHIFSFCFNTACSLCSILWIISWIY